MEDELLKCLDELTIIRKYLVKKGKSRFKGNVIKNKLAETEIIFDKSKRLIQLLTTKEGIKTDILTRLTSLRNEIKSCYSQIIELCTETREDSSSSESDLCYTDSKTEITMEFDLKTACSLIPVMNSKENNIKSIIDSVEMYADMLSEAGKKLLITFVLKSRLSENAKLRMSNNYTSANDLVRDLRSVLLPKKSFTAIQSRLQNTTQGWRTIDQYGTEIEKLFTNLTISQADGNSQNYSVLKPLNEKLAIKRFADGLSDSRLSTIIAARNYHSLTDAIQAAKDEELAVASTSRGENVMQYSHHARGRSQANYFRRGRFYNRQPRGQRGNYNQYSNNHRNFGNSRGRSFYRSRGETRGSFNANRGRGYQVPNKHQSSYETHGSGNSNGNRVLYTDQSSNNEAVTSNSEEMQFFRSKT